jgi:hypothetical protein
VLPRLLALAGAMLVIAVILNWKDLYGIATHKKTITSVIYGRTPSSSSASFGFPEPLGPPDAKVKVWVICQEGNSCHQPLVAIWAGIASLEPKRLRVEFYSPWEAPKTDGKPLELGCDSGVAINKQTKFQLGSGKDKRTVYLTGPTPAPPKLPDAPEPPPDQEAAGHGWSIEDLATLVNQLIEKAYKQKGALTEKAIQDAWSAAGKSLPQPSEELLKSGAGHGGGHAMPPPKSGPPEKA